MVDIQHEERLYIDGDLVDAEGGATYENINPATEEVLGVAADASVGDIDRAIAAARQAFDETGWATDRELRARVLRQLHQALLDDLEDIRAMTVAEVGTPVGLTHGPQLDAPVAFLPYYADLVESYAWTEDLGDAEPMGIPSHRWIEKEAVGVVGAITAWNFPHQLNIAKLAPALAAGNTVVLKGAPATPWSALALGRLLAEKTDLPAGVVNIITSSQNDIGEAITTDPRVDLITFTGSTAVGKRIMAAAADTVKKVFLELGGKSALVALDDCDIPTAAATSAFAVCTHAGQGCAIPTRLLLPRSRYDEGVETVREMLGGMPYGDPTDPANLMGPLVSEVQRERVLGMIRDAEEDGGKVILGGKRPEHLDKGWFVEPTLIVDVDPDSRIAQQEVFGPVLVVIPYEDDDDAVRIANNSVYGLSGGVLSGDVERAKAVGRRIRAGTLMINGGVYYGADVPFGGYRQSGLGREMGVAGFEEYLETKAFAEPRVTAFAPSGSARIAYDDEGSGPPVLLAHAGVTDRRSWRSVIDALAPMNRVLAFDQRGFGETVYEPERQSGVDDGLAVLDHAGVEGPVALVGCSMGGRLSLDLTLAHPDRVSRLVLIGSACRGAPGPDDWPDSYRELGLALDAAEEADDLDEVNRLEAWMWLDGPSAPEGRVSGAARTLFLAMNARALASVDPGEEVDRPSAWDALGQIAVPTLVLIGDLDLEDVRDTSEGLAARIPEATLEVLAGTAHVPQLEAHPRFLQAVGEFLA